jgi:predicted transcriptional regulator
MRHLSGVTLEPSQQDSIVAEQISKTKRLLALGHIQVDVASLVGISQAAVSDINLGKKDHRLNG